MSPTGVEEALMFRKPSPVDDLVTQVDKKCRKAQREIDQYKDRTSTKNEQIKQQLKRINSLIEKAINKNGAKDNGTEPAR